MKLQKLITDMRGPSMIGAELPNRSYIFLPVTLTMQIISQRMSGHTGQALSRFSTDAGEVIWARGELVDFDPLEILIMFVKITQEGLEPLLLEITEETSGLPWESLYPVPEEIIDHLPADVADEIRLNMAGNFAGDTP